MTWVLHISMNSSPDLQCFDFFSFLCPRRTDFAAFPPYLLRALSAWSFSLALPCRENLLQKAAQSFPYAHAVFLFGRVDITIFQRSVQGWQSSCWNYVLYLGEKKVIPICFIQCRRLGERRGEEGGRQGSNPYSSALSSAPLSPCPVSPLLPFYHLSLSLHSVVGGDRQGNKQEYLSHAGGQRDVSEDWLKVQLKEPLLYWVVRKDFVEDCWVTWKCSQVGDKERSPF